MPDAEQRPSLRVNVGVDTRLLMSSANQGVRREGNELVLSEEKRTAIREVMAELLPLLTANGHLLPLDTDAIDSYRAPTPLSEFMGRRLHRINALLGDPFRKDESEQYFQNDEAYYLRGVTLGDILITAVVTDGLVISNPREGYTTQLATTQVTSGGAGAADYAVGKSQEKITARRILYALQLDSFGFTLEDVRGSILMSPEVLRFIEPAQAREDAYGVPMGLPYVSIIPPYSLVETTTAWRNNFAQRRKINILDLVTRSQEVTQRHLQ